MGNNGMTLKFDEIVRVDNIGDLISLYSQKGLNFESVEKFWEQLKTDWQSEVRSLKKSADSMPIPQSLPSLDVALDGVTYSIFGVIHDFASGSQYRKLVSNAVNTRHNWLYEQGIGTFFKKENGSVEIPDLTANSLWSSFKEELIDGAILPLFFVGFAYRYIRPSKTAEGDLKELNIPLEARGRGELPLPAYVELELKEKQGKPLTHCQLRSGYHAEFMRAYRPSEDKNFLVGANHAPEIKYFLKKGVKESMIVDLAHHHAELLMSDPEKYHAVLRRATAEQTLAMFSGVMVGASPYIAMLTLFM